MALSIERRRLAEVQHSDTTNRNFGREDISKQGF